MNSALAGCGKTYTMLGTDQEPGIYVRTLDDLFRAIEESSDDMLYSVSMSYLEVSLTSAGTTLSRAQAVPQSDPHVLLPPPEKSLFLYG